MTRSIKQLRNDLGILNVKIKDLATELQSLYQDYFPQLIAVVKRQLILAAYQVCTQKYPSAFLALSYQNKVNLQKHIKDLHSFFPKDLYGKISEIEIIDNIFLHNLKSGILAFVPYQNDVTLLTESKENETETFDKDNILEGNHQNDSLLKDDNLLEICPENLIQLQVEVDDAIEECLIKLSHQVNKYLQEIGILPKNIPAKILEVALQAEENTSLISGAPNLLSLLIEKDDKSEDMNITPVVALCLRINEIEFNDPLLNQNRQKISRIFQSLNNLDDEYQNKYQQYQIALAESAWRSSWIDD
ncbi:hypothetical protein VKI21_17915 [Cyanobacterium aponinum UTEX 3222]|uniref:hypothetical protein n=1 Tax=Cyanobacterium aponinum TaxID=379064 RepID=UPI003093A326|nr:hypothetical protein VKI21_17915 [Cyanobacterium aponinum UTEX 3222]